MKPKIQREYYSNGQLKSEQYHLNGKYHRIDGPAYSRWYSNGQLKSEQYLVKDKHHRTDGPCHRYWDENGQLWWEVYWFKGKMIPEEIFFKLRIWNEC